MNSINFLYNQNQSSLDKFINWALTYGRTIVMLTEVIALAAFIYRFGMDRQLVNLHENIKQQGLMVSLVEKSGAEDSYRNLQNRLSVSSTISAQSVQFIQILFNTIDKSNGVITFETINETTKTIELKVLAQSPNDLNSFINTLEEQKYVDAINIDSIATYPQTQQVESIMSVALHSSNTAL